MSGVPGMRSFRVLTWTEYIGKDWKFGEHGGEPLDQRQQAVLGHCGDEFVEHAALPK